MKSALSAIRQKITHHGHTQAKAIPRTLQPVASYATTHGKMPVPVTLTGLTPREAVADALYRAVESFDKDDTALFESAFTEDAVFDLAGTVSTGRAAVHAEVFNKVAKLDTTHFITSQRIHLADAAASSASLTASALAQHYPAGQGKNPEAKPLLAGSQYELELVKESSGLWKIKSWVMQIVWADGDWGVFA